MDKTTRRACIAGAMAAIFTWCGLQLAFSQEGAAAASGLTVKGQVTIPADWSMQKPDLARTVVYLASAPALDAVAPPKEPAVVAQKNKAFDPPFSVISVGRSVEFPNWDHFDHNVFSRSPAAPAFDLSRYPYGSSKAIRFGKVGLIQLFCNIHPDMRALIFVTPNSFFSRADKDGHFVIENVPAGEYELVAWNERCPQVQQKITVAAGGIPAVSLMLHEDRDNVASSDPPKERNEYGVERGLSVKREQLNLPVVQGVHAASRQPDTRLDPGSANSRSNYAISHKIVFGLGHAECSLAVWCHSLAGASHDCVEL